MTILLAYPSIVIVPLIVLIEPLKGLARGKFRRLMVLQLALFVVWAALGGTLVGGLLWRLGGGCAGHGGSFDGACGYAGVATSVIAGYGTAVVMTTICGIVFRLWIQRPAKP
ncbi:hypothetical protein RM543_06855 [Roseicyclus sp. F158]|uniref:Uncharacterized protein n=1 Tax=Tropicimonas omnivorans TaxID=3075590 RepID=A0ABU3DFE1_9RHOB|nr:hypothetical protein [Roseicyclus sp. F158]MDT0682397.1 hypothetical protein [Roseicyclus sp. F158]